MNIANFNLAELERDSLRKATPVARKWANFQINHGKTFPEIEDEFMEIMAVEDKIYNNMKDSLVHHIRRHGLDAQALVFFDEFQEIHFFDRNRYNSLLKKIRHAYAKSNGNLSLEYLIAKLNEYLNKISSLTKTAWDMLQNGMSPDFDAWSDKVVIQDNLFEENKQFLKQTLHHLEILEKNKRPLGIPEIKLLLYHTDGCRREKLYRRTEEWIIHIYCQLSEDEKHAVYKDICAFVKKLVPQVGYISPVMIDFILDRDFISQNSCELLVSIAPVIKKLQMYPIIINRLQPIFSKALKNLQTGKLTESDIFSYELMKLYAAKRLSPETIAAWDNIVK